MDSEYIAAIIETDDGVATLEGFEGLFQNLLGVALSFAGIALFLMLLLGGVQFMTAGGDPKKVSSAWNTITYAVIGMVLVAISILILTFFSEFTGFAGLLNFEVSP